MIEKADQHNDPRLRLNFRQLEVFVATARGGSTRAAADRISRSQSAASNALGELEEALGVKLFDRVGRRLILNENGRALLPKALSLVDQATAVQQLFCGEHDAPLRVSASFTIGEYLLPERIARWKADHPGSRVQMFIGNSSEVIEAVAGFEVDIGFVEGLQTHPDVNVKPWLTDELVIVAAPSHALAGKPVRQQELSAASWVLRERGSGTRDAADRWLLEHLSRLNVEFEVGSTEAIKRLVASGNAITCLSRHAVCLALKRGWLIELTVQLPKAVRRLSMVMHRDKRLGSVTANFIRHCSASESGPPPGR